MTKMDSLNKKCLVCGDTAVGFNFNGLSCGSCRLFFYRNASKLEKLKCPKNETCQIDFATRKCCQKCRLTKCFSIGMLPKGSIPKYRTKHIATKPQTVRNLIREKIIQKTANNFELNQAEQKYLGEIQLAYESVFQNELHMKIIGECTMAQDAINMNEIYIRKVVKFCKAIQTFKQLKPQDQLTILKPFCYEILGLRLSYYYDLENDGYRMIVDEHNRESVILVKISLFNGYKNSTLLDRIMKLALELQREMENDTTTRNLIALQLLFRPRDGVTCPEFLKYQYSIYCHLLQRHLECKYRSIDRAKQKLYTLTSIVKMLYNSRDDIRLLMAEIATDVMAESIAEAFNFTN